MILDTMDNLKRYAFLHPDREKAAAFLSDPENLKKPDGRYPLTERCYVSLQSYTTKDASEGRFEMHEQNADIQVILSGRETIAYACAPGLIPLVPFDPARDAAFYDAKTPAGQLYMTEGLFAIFLPGEAHRPGCAWERPSPVRKAVVKLQMDDPRP